MRVLTVIPARGGSTRIPNKAMAMFCGRPLIDYTLNIAKRCKLNAVVSTDSEQIYWHAMNLGFDAIRRPAELANHTASTVSVLQHAKKMYSERDTVLCLQPTNPLRLESDVQCAFTLMGIGHDSVCSSVRCSDRHPAWCFGDGRTIGDTFHNSQRSQLKAMYHRDGTVYMAKRHIIDAGSLCGELPGAVEIPPERAVNIDEPHDLVIAEALFRKYIEKDYQWVL